FTMATAGHFVVPAEIAAQRRAGMFRLRIEANAEATVGILALRVEADRGSGNQGVEAEPAVAAAMKTLAEQVQRRRAAPSVVGGEQRQGGFGVQLLEAVVGPGQLVRLQDVI